MTAGLIKRLALIASVAGFPASSHAGTTEPLVGDDSDTHGCKASAGYAWCEKTARCERPWELAKAQGYENSAEAFRAFCSG